MSNRLEYHHKFTCDRCGKKKLVVSRTKDETDFLPGGWYEVACTSWEDREEGVKRGDDRRFAELCPTCIKECGIVFKEHLTEEEEE